MKCVERSFSWTIRNSQQEKDGRWVAKEATEGFKIAVGDDGDYDSTLVADTFEAMKDELKLRLSKEVGLIKVEDDEPHPHMSMIHKKLKTVM